MAAKTLTGMYWRSGPSKSHNLVHMRWEYHAAVRSKQPLIRATPQRRYHEIMTLNQAGPTIIGYDDTDRRSLVAIKRRKAPNRPPIHQVQVKSNYLVGLRDMYVEENDVVFIYEQIDVSLRYITGILQGPLKAFQIAANCKEVRVRLANLSCTYSRFTTNW